MYKNWYNFSIWISSNGFADSVHISKKNWEEIIEYLFER